MKKPRTDQKLYEASRNLKNLPTWQIGDEYYLELELGSLVPYRKIFTATREDIEEGKKLYQSGKAQPYFPKEWKKRTLSINQWQSEQNAWTEALKTQHEGYSDGITGTLEITIWKEEYATRRNIEGSREYHIR